MKDSRRSLLTYTESLFLHVVKHNMLFLILFYLDFKRLVSKNGLMIEIIILVNYTKNLISDTTFVCSYKKKTLKQRIEKIPFLDYAAEARLIFI